jgi:demethylmenaquinone methyltransferase/2-methoxy-6-polyprenyl-1,4-benzoquinol methylase
MTTTGAKPPGASDEASAAQAVREMFDAIAPRYDLLNHVLSMNVDRMWWWRAARRFDSVLADPDAAVLDICCGTGDMTMALLKRRPQGARPILAADFARKMLSRGARKFAAKKFGGPGVGCRENGEAYAVPLASAIWRITKPAFASFIAC